MSGGRLDERYMELPLDADGVPIHIGDLLTSDEYDGNQYFHCSGLNVEVFGGIIQWTVRMCYDSYTNTSEYTQAIRCHHVKNVGEYIVTCDEETAEWIGNEVDSMRPIGQCRDCGYFHICDFTESYSDPDVFYTWGEKKEEEE